MNLQTAIKILESHQEWRLGKIEDMIYEPKKITEALDIVICEVKYLASKRYIELKRSDLQKDKKDKPIENITLYDFNPSVMSRKEMGEAELIIFVDGEHKVELKSR